MYTNSHRHSHTPIRSFLYEAFRAKLPEVTEDSWIALYWAVGYCQRGMWQGDIALRTGLGEELGVGRGFAECEGRLGSADPKTGHVEMYGFGGEFEQGAAWLGRRYRYPVSESPAVVVGEMCTYGGSHSEDEFVGIHVYAPQDGHILCDLQMPGCGGFEPDACRVEHDLADVV